MTDLRHTHEPDDETLVKHFRQQSSAEPSASLDALILAAARRQAPTPRPSLWQRWLKVCQRPRLQLAFATVAGVALMIGLVLRSPVPEPARSLIPYDSLPQAMLAQPISYSAERHAPVQALSAPAAPAPAPRPIQAEHFDAELNAGRNLETMAKTSKRAPVETLEQGLREIVRLRDAGEAQAADQKLLILYQRFPGENLPALIEALSPARARSGPAH